MSFSRVETTEHCTLYLGDCLDVLPTLGKVDAVVTDPPYGLMIPYESFDDTRQNVKELADGWVPLCRGLARNVSFTPGLGSEDLYPKPDHVACWFMEAGGYRSSWGFGMWQPVLCYGKDPFLSKGLGARPDVIKTNHFGQTEKFNHPCPKPIVVWLKFLERFSLPGESVLDPFMGSGTTGVACIKTGRKFIGIEKEPKYFEIALKRIREAERMAKCDLFKEEKPVERKQLELV